MYPSVSRKLTSRPYVCLLSGYVTIPQSISSLFRLSGLSIQIADVHALYDLVLLSFRSTIGCTWTNMRLESFFLIFPPFQRSLA